MFGAELRNLYRTVAGINHLLPNAFNLITENNSIFASLLGSEILKWNTALNLFYCVYSISLLG